MVDFEGSPAFYELNKKNEGKNKNEENDEDYSWRFVTHGTCR